MSDVNAEAGAKPEVEGEQGNGDASLVNTASNSSTSEGSSEPTSANAAASDDNSSAGDAPNGADTLPAVPVTVAAMVSRVEAAALQAFNASNTTEHNLMAWLHTHLTGARAAVAGAEGLEGLSPEGKAILAALKELL
jgi:hypothetical protein